MSPDNIIALISAVRARSVDFLETELKARGIVDLKPSHGALLSSLFGRGGRASMKDLLRSKSRKKTTLTEMANKLEKQGYVRRVPDPVDARGVILELTDKAMSIKGNFDEISKLLLAKAWTGFSGEEQKAMMALLERMMESF